VAVVTGAGSPDGIGFAAARMLAELGAAVMITAPTARIEDRASELCSAGFDAAGFATDLTRPGPHATGPDGVITAGHIDLDPHGQTRPGQRSSRSRTVISRKIIFGSNHFISSDIRVIISTYRIEKSSDDHPYI
jgi:hypothetical protein